MQQESHSMARTQPHPVPRNRFPNLPADVRLPPSLHHPSQSQELYGNQYVCVCGEYVCVCVGSMCVCGECVCGWVLWCSATFYAVVVLL